MLLANQKWRLLSLLFYLLLFFPHSSAQVISDPSASGTQVTINQIDHSEFPKIKVYASVSRAGLSLSGLTAKNFRIRENDVDQGLIQAMPQREAISAVLLLDVSGSMKEAIPATKEAAVGFVNSLKKQDKIQVTTFHERVDTIYPLGQDFNAAKAAIWKIRDLDDTALYDGVHAAIKSISHVPGRRVVIVLSDGVDDDGYGNQLSQRDLDEPLMLAIVSNVPVYTIGLGTDMNVGVLKSLAGTTGAEYANAPTKSELKKLYERIARQLSCQYELIYYSSKADVGRVRDVKLDYVVPSRKPYAAPQAMLNESGEVTEYTKPELNEAEKRQIAELARAGKASGESDISEVDKISATEAPEQTGKVSEESDMPEAGRASATDSSDQASGEREVSEDGSVEPGDIVKPESDIQEVEGSNEPAVDQSSVVAIDEGLPEADVLRVDRDNANQIIAADGRNVEIASNGGIIVVSGNCNKLIVEGGGNQIQCDTVRFIKLEGDRNNVRIKVLGRGWATGSNNKLSWEAGEGNAKPTIQLDGQANSAEPAK